MSSRPLPDDPREVSRWIAETIDGDRQRVYGRNWKDRILGGSSVHKLMADIPSGTTFHFRVSMQEAIVVARVLAAQPLTRNAFMRRALAHWLVTKEGVDIDLIPNLAKDL